MLDRGGIGLGGGAGTGPTDDATTMTAPKHIDLDRKRGLTIHWPDGRVSFYTIAHLRRMSPSAETRELRRELSENPLAILPSRAQGAGPIEAEGAELVGNYALRIRFSDGHSTGIYSWKYLRDIDHGSPLGSAP